MVFRLIESLIKSIFGFVNGIGMWFYNRFKFLIDVIKLDSDKELFFRNENKRHKRRIKLNDEI